MGQLVIRNLDDDVKARLKRRAQRHGQSMEAEAREILRAAVASETAAAHLGRRLVDRFKGIGLDAEIVEIRSGQPLPATPKA